MGAAGRLGLMSFRDATADVDDHTGSTSPSMGRTSNAYLIAPGPKGFTRSEEVHSTCLS